MGTYKEHFERLEKTPKKKRYKVRCKHCVRVGKSIKVVTGRPKYYARHLDSCEAYKTTLPEISGPAGPPTPLQWNRSQLALFESVLVQFQHRHRLADSFIECDETIMLLELLVPGISAFLPTRRQLGGRILREQAGNCVAQAISDLMKICLETGGKVNLLGDVWENISKQHMLGSQLLLFGFVMIFLLEQVGAEHQGIAIAKDFETLIEKATSDGWTIGAVVTDDAGQCARARRILALRWPRIVFLRCFAHDVNNFVKQALKSIFRATAREAAAAVIALNASSAKWLRYFTDIQKRQYGKKRALIALCPTRWNSMQGCFASLLRSRTALRLLCCEHSTSQGWPAALNVLDDADFWSRLQEAEQIICPLSVASFRLQRDRNTLADVVVMFGEIYRKFAANQQYGASLVECVEQRWNNCEQPLFMLTLYLHPMYAKPALMLRRTAVSDPSRIIHFAVYYYRRYVDENVDGLRDSLNAWFSGGVHDNKANRVSYSSSYILD